MAQTLGLAPDAVTDVVRAHESNTGRILAVTGTFYSVSLITCCLRVYTQVVLVKALRKEDYAIISAIVRSSYCSIRF